METLNKVVKNPSGWDSSANYIGESDFPGMLVALTRNRDSDTLTRSNWESALKMLGGESETVVIHRFGHWACGWWEALCVRENTPSELTAKEIESSLADYPVLNENHLSELEYTEANDYWNSGKP